jgi:hypothetical protein
MRPRGRSSLGASTHSDRAGYIANYSHLQYDTFAKLIWGRRAGVSSAAICRRDAARWLPSKPLRWLLRYACNFVSVMATQKLILPDRMPEEGPHFALRANASAVLDRGSILLH